MIGKRGSYFCRRICKSTWYRCLTPPSDWKINFDLLLKLKFIWGGSPGLVVMGGDSRSEGCGFESQCHILDGHFSH